MAATVSHHDQQMRVGAEHNKAIYSIMMFKQTTTDQKSPVGGLGLSRGALANDIQELSKSCWTGYLGVVCQIFKKAVYAEFRAPPQIIPSTTV